MDQEVTKCDSAGHQCRLIREILLFSRKAKVCIFYVGDVMRSAMPIQLQLWQSVSELQCQLL